MVIESSKKQHAFLSKGKFEDFLNYIEQGDGANLSKDDLTIFVNLLPTEIEVIKFKERLAEYNIDNFKDLKQIHKPFTLKI
jgi:hypothetical protein